MEIKNVSIMIDIAVTISILHLFSYAVGLEVQQITKRPRAGEFLLDTNIAYVPAIGWQAKSSATFDGTNYFVVWTDQRDVYADIYGARVDLAGNVLDPVGIPISTEIGLQAAPSVAFDGTNFFVVWRDARTETADIYGARVDQSGNVLDPNGIAISTRYKAEPAIAFDGTNYLVVWEDSRNGTDKNIYGTRIDQSGNVLDPNDIPITTAINSQYQPAVCFDGTNYLVVWEDWRSGTDIYGARVDQSGTVLDSDGIPVSNTSHHEWHPSVAFDGTNYLVVWIDDRIIPYEQDIFGARVDPSGTVLDPDGITISIAENHQQYPSVAFDGTNYLVVWQDYRNGTLSVYGSHVDTSGSVLDPDGIVISEGMFATWWVSVAGDGTNILVLWSDDRGASAHNDYYYDIYGARVDHSGAVLDPDPIIISTSAYYHQYPATAFDGKYYLVVWQDYRSGTTYDIYGTRVSQSAHVLDPDGIAISVAKDHQQNPAAAFDGTNYLVVWQDYRNGSSYDIFGGRIDQTGHVIDSKGIEISTAADDQASPSIAFDGTNYLVVWEDRCFPSFDIHGTRVDQSGNVLDPDGFAISTTSQLETSPAVSFDGTNFLVVWAVYYLGGAFDVFGARVDKLGNVLDPSGIAISTAAGAQWYPSVAFDGTNYLVVWEDDRSGVFDIYGARVDQFGTVLDSDGIPLSIAENEQEYPSVAFDGTNYLVAWEDQRNSLCSDIYGAKVSPEGEVLNSYAICIQPGNQESSILEPGRADSILICYSGWTDTINVQPAHTMRTWGIFYPFVGIEEYEERPTSLSEFGLELFPNPVHKICNIKYVLAQNSDVTISLFDAAGRRINNIVHETQNVGVYHKVIEVSDLPQGVYFIKLFVDPAVKTRNYTETKKAILLK